MTGLYDVEIEPEVRTWLEALPARHYRKVERMVMLLAADPLGLGEPHARHLGEGVRELRPTIAGTAFRITYWLTSRRTVVLLTVFRKTKMREDAEVDRAKQMKKICEAEHGPAHEVFERDVDQEELG
ncbi:type II toxin-antitoxin system RelE/ParE family toxin [Actinocorallia populi]|uniref:type II toxin-antitoxin system RelE/ParE family toxin n=1 Tax=Actinocorallia populi TaxID=2079200 RepID=UPI000D088CDC|nr:type II toxin-antitoxin system RelE/ParE family toxin [Actinocorallia populi]